MSGPSANQCSAARSIDAATHWKGCEILDTLDGSELRDQVTELLIAVQVRPAAEQVQGAR